MRIYGFSKSHSIYFYVRFAQLEGSEQERSLDFSVIFGSVQKKLNFGMWTLSKMAEKSRDRSCSEPSNCSTLFLTNLLWSVVGA